MINYNGEKYLKRTIPPILKLNYPNYEFIIVDNESRDNSVQLIKSFKKIILVKNRISGSKNRGLNLGIKKARGEYLLFLDNDVLITDKNLLQDLLSEFLKSSKIGLMTLTLLNEGEKSIYLYGEFLNIMTFMKRNEEICLNKIKNINGKSVVGMQGAAFFSRKDIFNKIGRFDELIPFGGDDIDLGIRSIIHGFKNIIYSKKILIHIGMDERTNPIKHHNKYFNYYVGWLNTIIKNYSFSNAILSTMLFMPYMFLKTIKTSIKMRDPLLIWEYIKIPFFLIINTKNIISRRRKIQSKRVVKEDIFLKIKPPKFD